MSILQKRVLGIRLRAWMLFFLLLPIALWGLLNLFFSTAWGTGFLERKIGARIGLDCSIESVTWSPWAGVVIENFEISPPSESRQKTGMVTIEQIRVNPSWTSLLKGKKRWEKLEVQKMDAEISIEMLQAILSRYEKPTPGALVVADKLEKGNQPELPKPAVEGDKPEPESGAELPPVVKTEERSAGAQGEPLAETIPVEGFEGEIVFSDSRVRLYSEKIPELAMTFRDLEGEIPIWGGAREGNVTVGKIQFGERFVEESLLIPVKWEDRSLMVSDYALKLFGLNMELSAAVLLYGGYPVGLQVELPTQQMDLTPVFLGRKSPIEVGSLRSVSFLKGYLAAPASFHGQSTTGFDDFVFYDLTDGGETRFHSGSSQIKVSGAGVVVEDIRMVGDDDALLMNGFATAGGDVAATVRIVSSPERAESHEKRVRQSGGDLTLGFQELVTPDREFRDIRIEARSGLLMMDLGIERSWVPFVAAAKAILGRENTELPNLP